MVQLAKPRRWTLPTSGTKYFPCSAAIYGKISQWPRCHLSSILLCIWLCPVNANPKSWGWPVPTPQFLPRIREEIQLQACRHGRSCKPFSWRTNSSPPVRGTDNTRSKVPCWVGGCLSVASDLIEKTRNSTYKPSQRLIAQQWPPAPDRL